MKIHFEDHGQDFLTWHLNNNGIVVDVEPFQASFWVGLKVDCARSLKAGDLVQYQRVFDGGDSATGVIRYPIREIEPTMTADQFNAAHAVGTPCRYYPLAGDACHRKTKTRSEAWELGHGAVIVKVEGVSGGVDINHLVMETAR